VPEAETAQGAPIAYEALVLELVRELALELHGERAAHVVSPTASLEREVGLGSLERVELLVRLEARLGRPLADGLIGLETPAELARGLQGATGAPPPGPTTPTRVEPLAPTSEELSATTLHAALWQRAELHPNRPQAFLREDDGRELTLTYGQLRDEARAVAHGLRERGVEPGATVALMLPTGLDFLRSFQGILLAGAVPVPIYPPLRLDRLEEYALRQSAILKDAGVKVLITIARARPVATILRSAVPSLNDVVTADELAEGGPLWDAPAGRPEDAAFIQYTSGSTGQPKGVLLTHANLLANIRAIAAGLDARPGDVGASWLPLYHDMGLIGSWLFCLVRGYPIDIQSPLSFLARPERWLWAIHRRRATLSAAPNFAYELCVRRISDAALEGLDLSSWRCALNGAEPVQPETLERFAQRFARYGFRREALLPVYGLAENSVALAFPPPGRGPLVDAVGRSAFADLGRAEAAPGAADALRFVSVGRVLPEHELEIVDARGEPCGERVMGRIAFRGPSRTSGYFRQPEATAALMLPNGLMDTGDLGYLAEGELFVTGRAKDLIIKGGRNLVPQEIEEVAGAVRGVRRGCVAAFGVEHTSQGTELLVIVAETREKRREVLERIETAVIEAVAAHVGVPPDRVVLVLPGGVPKTSSGKIRRAATRAAFERGQLGKSEPAWRSRARLAGAVLQEQVRVGRHALVRAAYAAYLALVFVPVALLFWLVALLSPGRRAAHVLARFGARLSLRLLGCRIEVLGREHLPRTQGCLLAANHTSYLDVLSLIAALPHDLVFVAKQEAFSMPIVGLFLRRAGHIAVDRSDAQDSLAASERLTETLRQGCSVLVFPEGTFTAIAGLRPFRLGVFKTAAELGQPVVPVALQGVRRALRDGAWLPRPTRLRVFVSPPIAPAGREWRDIVELRDRVALAIAAECGEPRLDLVVAAPKRPRA